MNLVFRHSYILNRFQVNFNSNFVCWFVAEEINNCSEYDFLLENVTSVTCNELRFIFYVTYNHYLLTVTTAFYTELFTTAFYGHRKWAVFGSSL